MNASCFVDAASVIYLPLIYGRLLGRRSSSSNMGSYGSHSSGSIRNGSISSGSIGSRIDTSSSNSSMAQRFTSRPRGAAGRGIEMIARGRLDLNIAIPKHFSNNIMYGHALNPL
jgi:hypothetical protein